MMATVNKTADQLEREALAKATAAQQAALGNINWKDFGRLLAAKAPKPTTTKPTKPTTPKPTATKPTTTKAPAYDLSKVNWDDVARLMGGDADAGFGADLGFGYDVGVVDQTVQDNTRYDAQYGTLAAMQEAIRANRRLEANQGLYDLGDARSTGMEALSRQYREGLEPRVSQFGRRNLENSGLFRGAMLRYAEDNQRGQNELDKVYQRGIGDISRVDNQTNLGVDTELRRLQVEKTDRIVKDAQDLLRNRSN